MPDSPSPDSPSDSSAPDSNAPDSSAPDSGAPDPSPSDAPSGPHASGDADASGDPDAPGRSGGPAEATSSAEATPSPVPMPVTPADGTEIDEASVAFEWTPVDGAENYELELSRDSSFATTAFDGRVGEVTTFTYSGLPPQEGVTMHWRVRARVDGTWGDFGDVGTFEVVDWQPSQPDLVPAAREAGTGETGAGDAQEPVARDTQSNLEPVLVVASMTLVVGIIALYVYLQPASDVPATPTANAAPPPDTTQIDVYRVVDEEAGVYQIPIDSAMQRLVRARDATPEPEATLE